MHNPDVPQQVFNIHRVGKVILTELHTDNPKLKIILFPEFYSDLTDIDPCELHEDGGRLYLSCDSRSLANKKTQAHPKLMQFVEVLAQHDHDGDGIYDADDVIDAIELAMIHTNETPVIFKRPTFSDGWFRGLMMSFMPPPPPQRHIAYSFGDLKRRFRGRDYLWAVPAFLFGVVLIQVQIYFFPWMKYSVVSGYFAGMEWLGVGQGITICVLVGLVVQRFRKTVKRTTTGYTYGFFSGAALWEEQVWREGAHRWSMSQRIASCMSFGIIHMSNLIYPLATILPIALGGAVLMWIYLREYRKLRAEGHIHARRGATLKAAVAHRLYNRVVLFAVAVVLTSALIWDGINLLGLAAMVATVFGTVIMDQIHWRRVADRTNQTPATVVDREKVVTS
jgi:hypothetical protein